MSPDMTIPMELLLPLLFFLIAAAYSSVGFGGGSSYLAILSIFLTSFYEIRSTALLLNLMVVSVGTWMYIRHRIFDWRAFWPFLVASIPLAFLGATLKLSEKTFFLFLGGLLILSGMALFQKFLFRGSGNRDFSLLTRVGVGGAVGFFSGVTGIGGGIYLSPFLNIIGWKDPRKIAALASVFILANSLAGVSGLLVGQTFQISLGLLWKLSLAVAAGGILGAYLSNRKLNVRAIGLLTALLVIYVGLRLLLLHGFGLRI